MLTTNKEHEITPTDEQLAALDAFTTGDTLRLLAFAGAGKTTTLSLIANSTRARGIYLTFSRANAEAAAGRFPATVGCSTSHSLAWKAIQRSRNFTGQKLTSRIFPNQLANQLDLKTRSIDGGLAISGRQLAHLTLSTIRNFCHSSDEEIRPCHMSLEGRLSQLHSNSREELLAWVLDTAKSLWGMMISEGHPIPLGHDGYQKLWALSQPRLGCDYLLLDEAQDTNEVVLGVLREQSCQVVYVGDPYQQIYEWRGAVNAMEKLEAGREVALTQSFRFGAAVADAATSILRTLGETRTIQGNPARNTQLLHQGTAQTVLARTNVRVFAEVLNAQKQGLRVHVTGGVRDLADLLEDVKALRSGRPARQPELFGFGHWRDVIRFSESAEGRQLRQLVGLVEGTRLKALEQGLKAICDSEASADRIVSTAHKAKGREWPNVRLAPGFAANGKRLENRPADIRLFYVALTRASHCVVVQEQELKSLQQPNFSNCLA